MCFLELFNLAALYCLIMSFPKKEKETTTIRYFIDKYPKFPKGRLLASESPDFILKENAKTSIGIELTHLVDYKNGNSFYKNIETSLIQKLSEDIFRHILEQKEEKINLYRKQKLKYIWLIITADNLDLPKSMNINDVVLKWNLSTSFDKVFLFDLFRGEVYLIK